MRLRTLLVEPLISLELVSTLRQRRGLRAVAQGGWQAPETPLNLAKSSRRAENPFRVAGSVVTGEVARTVAVAGALVRRAISPAKSPGRSVAAQYFPFRTFAVPFQHHSPQTDSILVTSCGTVWCADLGGGVGNVRDRFKVCPDADSRGGSSSAVRNRPGLHRAQQGRVGAMVAATTSSAGVKHGQ